VCARDVERLERRGQGARVYLSDDLEAIVKGLVLAVCEHEAELEDLFVGERLCVQHQAPVQLALTLVDLRVFLEELQLHFVALRVERGALRNDVVDLDIGRVVDLRLSFLDEAGQR